MSELKSINRFRFLKLNKQRRKVIAAAPATPVDPGFPVNKLAAALHPQAQHVKISAIKEWGPDCKTFTLVPDPQRGTNQLAYFQAGSYISVRLKTATANLVRPYSLSSSPRAALDGYYQITVKRVPDGIASNYLLDHCPVGTVLTVSGPLGNFTYLPIRDARTIIGIAGGSGITPFYSLAQAIADGDEDCRLILLYGSRTVHDILFREEFEQLERQCDQVQVINVLSDEQCPGYENGFITAELIKKYAPTNGQYSIFMCGPQGLYQFMNQELKKLRLEQKWVRQEVQGEAHDPDDFTDYPTGKAPKTVQLTVQINHHRQTITVPTNQTLLQSLEKNGIAAPAHCRAGECGWCHSRLISGHVFAPHQLDHRRAADREFHYLYLCCTYPLSDLTIEVPQPEI